MRLSSNKLFIAAVGTSVLACTGAWADVKIEQRPGGVTRVKIVDDTWRPEGFQEGLVIPASFAGDAEIFLDGLETEPAWARAEEIEVPLSYGTVDFALVKALYTDNDVIFRVRWADASEDRLHHPWVWDEDLGNYVEGPQLEDSLMFSFEVGCEWFPSFLAGYTFDFDAWHWMAGRTDPLGQVLDLAGSMKETQLSMNTPYTARNTVDEWNLRFVDTRDGVFYNHWEDLDRQFMLWPAIETVYFHANPDGQYAQEFTRKVIPDNSLPSSPALVPQFEPLKLEGNAAEVRGKGHWEDGYWTVELRRSLTTEGGGSYDIQINRLTQFSLHVFDHVERMDQSSESGRLWLTFLEKEPQAATHLTDE